MNIRMAAAALILIHGHSLNSMQTLPADILPNSSPSLQTILTHATHTPTIREEFINIITLMNEGKTAAPQVRRKLETLIDSICTVSELQRSLMILSFVTEIRTLPRQTTINQ